MHGKGLGSKLMTALMDAARQRGLKVIQGEVLSQNAHMLSLMKKLGFSIKTSQDDDSIRIVSKLL